MEKMLACRFAPLFRMSALDALTDRLVEWGYNAVIIEFEDRFRYSRHPAIAHPEAYAPEEWASFADRCRGKGLKVIPLVQSLGHAEFVLRKPPYRHLRQNPEIDTLYDPLSEEARALVRDLFDEVIDAVRPDGFFHLGGDETFGLGDSPACREAMAGRGAGWLYLQHMAPLLEHVRHRGLRPILWHDILVKHPERLCEVPRDVVMMEWNYNAIAERADRIRVRGAGEKLRENSATVNWGRYQEIRRRAGFFREYFESYCVDDEARETHRFRPFFYTHALLDMGFDVIVASGSYLAEPLFGLSRHRNTDLNDFLRPQIPNTFFGARKGFECGLGTVATTWASHNPLETAFPALFAAPYATRDRRGFDGGRLLRDFTCEFYGVECPELGQVMDLVEIEFPIGYGAWIDASRKLRERGVDWQATRLAEWVEKTGGAGQAIVFLDHLCAAYAAAETLLVAMQSRAQKNQENVAFWLEGVRGSVLAAKFFKAVVSGNLDRERRSLADLAARLRQASTDLFAGIYLPLSLKEEMDHRYGFFDEVLGVGR